VKKHRKSKNSKRKYSRARSRVKKYNRGRRNRRKSRNSFGIGGHHETRPSIAFDVFLNGKNIDTVFYSASSNVDADEVRRSLINHDGYDSGIVVRKARRRKKK